MTRTKTFRMLELAFINAHHAASLEHCGLPTIPNVDGVLSSTVFDFGTADAEISASTACAAEYMSLAMNSHGIP